MTEAAVQSRRFDTLSATNLQRIAALLYADAGIKLTPAKSSLVATRIAKRMRVLNLDSYDAYCDLVESRQGADERKQMLNALTTNVTRFYREPHHFEDLAQNVLPPLIEHARAGGRVRLWSAACSTGEEPYSIALTLLGVEPQATRYDIRILATDIDDNVLNKARAGVYSADALSSVPAHLRSAHFEPLEDGSKSGSKGGRAGDELRALIAFKSLNLIRPWPIKGPFDAIFCRNVVIYFDQPTQEVLWEQFARVMAPGSRLYLGHSERIAGPAAGFFGHAGLTAYARKGLE